MHDMTSRTLLLSTLIDKVACNSQTTLFLVKFGYAVEVTEELCASVAGEFDWKWAARALLREDCEAELTQLRDDYMAKWRLLSDDYQAKWKQLRDDYYAKHVLQDDYVAKLKLLYDELQDKLKPLKDDYLNQLARLFAKLYVAEGAT